ncbi:hypothetical protein CVO77_02895 [Sphingopyxis lindanitolerans]|uniref:Uncharacterized protein n=1 Tax=Sphingopyxis lindanitolerans TaxID=2054227 RepID=A0A2S8B5L7_9SPHN|nr:hypothetical protein [Sphingopyxis lindanitolerans]PQM27549.1 hypothetical protein CVO77_02895 [Sphingopyxis lindanitolerans]
MSDTIDEAKVSAAPGADDADTFLYDYFKHLTSLSVLTLGGVLAISTGTEAAGASRASMIAVVALVGVAALFAFSGTSEIVRQKATGKIKSKSLTFYRVGAPIALSLGVGAFLYLFLKGFPA